MKRHLFVLSLLLLITTASAQSVPSDGWVAWKVPVLKNVRIGCWDHGEGFSIMDEDGSGEMLVVARLKGGKITTLRGHDVACAPKTDAQRIEMDVNASVDFLARHIEDPADERIVSVLAMHESARRAAARALRRQRLPARRARAGRVLARPARRRGGLPLPARASCADPGRIATCRRKRCSRSAVTRRRRNQEADRPRPQSQDLRDPPPGHLLARPESRTKAAGELRRAVDEDPDDDVREHAVFAISQLPRERSVPLLIDLVRNHKSAQVREKAMFWLAQTNDPRALDLIEEILTK